jgi:hypothetical protein
MSRRKTGVTGVTGRRVPRRGEERRGEERRGEERRGEEIVVSRRASVE